MEACRNPFGRWPHPGSRIQLKIPTESSKNRRQKILAKRLGELRSRPLNRVMNSHAPARSRRAAEHSSFQRFSFQPFSSTQIPLFPRNPLFPASGLATGSLNGLNPKSKFLVFINPKTCWASLLFTRSLVDDPILQNRYKNPRHFTEWPPLKTCLKTQPPLKKPCIYMA